MPQPIAIEPSTQEATSGLRPRRDWPVRVVALCLLVSGCRREGSFTHQSIAEIFSDGRTVSVIASSEEVHHSKFVLEHGSGRHDEVSRATGLVRWRLPERAEPGSSAAAPVEPLTASTLDRQRAEASDDSGASVEPIHYRACSSPEALLCVDTARGRIWLASPSDPAGAPTAETRVDPMNFLDDVLVTRSGKHLLANRRGVVLILSTSDLGVVRELAPTPGLVDFRKRFAGVEDHARFLTDDLRYLVKIPFNAGEPQGFDHCVAVIHDLESDATDEVRLSLGEGATAIEDVEHVGGELVFLVEFMPRRDGRQLDTRTAIVDASSSVVAWLPDELFHDDAFDASTLYWDPARRRIAVWAEAGNRNHDLVLDAIVVAEHDYGSGATSRCVLGWGDTVQRLGPR